MDFEWDEEKRATNLEKHGLDLIDEPSCSTGVRYSHSRLNVTARNAL